MYHFFAPPGASQPCGMFGWEHLLLLCLSLLFITCALYFSRHMTKAQVRKTILYATLALWVLEIIKIVFNLVVNGADQPNSYIPLYYCSLILYCGLMSVWGKGLLKRCGDVFLGVGAFVGGAIFLVFPTTSLPNYPLFHYIAFHSFIFHSVMVYLGILVLMRGYVVLKPKDQLPYALVVLVAGGLAFVVNLLLDTNLMFVSKNFPGTPIELVYNFCGPTIFPIVMLLIHIFPPFWVMYGIAKLIQRSNHKQSDMPARTDGDPLP